MAEHSTADRIVDVASVALISAAAVLTALCSYQAGRWSGEQTRLYNLANVERTQASDALNRGFALAAIDVNLFLNYASAIEANDTAKSQFIYYRMPAEMRNALNAWIATKPLKNPHAPASPFVMPQYQRSMHADAAGYEASAARTFDDAQRATHRSDEFMLLTVVFAGVSFLAGMSTKMKFPRHAFVVTLGTLALLYGIVRLGGMPFL